MLRNPSQPTDRFVIESRVGGGASGDIFKAVDNTTQQPVAIKVLRGTATEGERARFERECKVLADLRHPNIVDYISHGSWADGRVFLAMEWLEGEDLSKRQRRAPLGTRDSVEVVRRAAQALAAIHSRGIVHRDLKLSNIYLVTGRGTAVKLIDFGVVKPSEPDGYVTEPGTILGTPHYMSPEQARGEPVDPRADVYSLGSVLFRLLTGRNVFETEHVIALLGRLVLEDPPPPSAFRFDIPEKLDKVIHQAISRDRARRFGNAGDFARALARVGQLNNDPPQVERSASAVLRRRKEESFTGTGATASSRPTRPGLRMRRVVACIVVDVGHTTQDPGVGDTLRAIAGEDVRIEQLAVGKTVGVLGVEHSRGDEVMRAARAALQIMKEFPQARAVVSNGHAVMARANLAGEALDRAARQLETAEHGGVRLDLHAAAALETRFEILRDANGAQLIREDPLDLAPRNVLGQPTPTVGREKEIALLQSLYSEMLRDSFPRAAVITGTPGIGKSRIRSELIQRLELAPVPPETLICRGGDAGGGSSVSALGKALRATMGVQDGVDPADQVQLVKRFVRSRLPRSLHFLGAFIGELVGVPFPDQNDEPLRAARSNDQLMQSRVRMALEAYLRTQAGRIPQIIIIEDAHEADDTTIELMDWVLACPDIRICVYAFAQPELESRRPDLWEKSRKARIEVGPLAADMAERLVADVLGHAPPQMRTSLVRRAAGNPFVLEELIRGAAEGRRELPLSVLALVQRRLDRLAPGAREVVRAASVFGRTFWSGGLSALLNRNVNDDLEVAVAEELIYRQTTSNVAGQVEYSFRQSLVREAAHSSLLVEDRKGLHLAAGEWLESAGCVDLGLIAHHFDLGGDRNRAASLYARATHQVLANFGQMDAALELARRGLACGAASGERAQLLLTQAHVFNRRGRLAEAMAAAEEAAKLVPPASDMWVEAQRLLSASLIESGRATEGDARLSWALGSHFSTKLSPATRSLLMSTRVRGLIDLNRTADALSVADEAVHSAQAAGRRGEVASLRALDARLFALMTACQPADAVETGERLIEAADRAGDNHLSSRARINTASALNYLGDYEHARQLLDEALVAVRSSRLRLLESSALHNMGMSAARLGDINRGIALQREAVRIADECAGARLALNSRIYESLMLSWRGEPGDYRLAHTLALQVLEASRTQLGFQMIALFVLAKVQLARRELADALQASESAYKRLSEGPTEEWEEHVWLCYIEVLLACGQEPQADQVLRSAYEAIRARANAISRPAMRESFISRNDEVVQLLALAAQRLHLNL